MPPKDKTVYVCSACAYETPKWMGRCPECGEWNTLEESLRRAPSKNQPAPATPAARLEVESAVTRLSELDTEGETRTDTGLSELNRVLGGGVVDGSVMLLTGDPGIGKSTLLLQVCKTLCESVRVLYVAGEESPRQIKLRARRIGMESDNLLVAPLTDMDSVMHAIDRMQPGVVMVDSIQTMHCETVSSSAGSVTQIRESASLLIKAAKGMDLPVFLVGHVNKDGGIAGPKILEHMVDVVLYFEGERHSNHRILRGMKNRFGSTNEIGVFEMAAGGLVDVENPSLMLLSGRPSGVSGTCVACVMEGTRPILAEVQALVTKTGFGNPRRMSTGFDFNRAALLIAVLEKRGGYFFGNLDAYVNIVGGLRLDEPAADLPVVMALVSNLLDKPIPDDLAAIGEVGLAGEVRMVTNLQARVNECVRLGFTRLLLPKYSPKQLTTPAEAEVVAVEHISQAFAAFR